MFGYNILLLSDGSYPFRTLAWELEYGGYTVKALGNPEDALEAMAKKDYDLIIAKLSREDKDNLTLLRQAKKINPLIKVLLITDCLDLAFPLEAYLIDIDDYLITPMSRNEFNRRVRRCLEGLIVDLIPTNSSPLPVSKVKKRRYSRLVCENILATVHP